MYKILIKELIYSESNSNKYTYLNKGDVHNLELYNVDTIASLIKQGFITKVEDVEDVEVVHTDVEDNSLETDVVVDTNKKPQVKKPKNKSSEEISE